jgi:hypothetical protein
VIGGYSLRRNWIGYLGHSLGDWLQLLLVPLVFPAIVIPAMLKSSRATWPGASRACVPPPQRTPAPGAARQRSRPGTEQPRRPSQRRGRGRSAGPAGSVGRERPFPRIVLADVSRRRHDGYIYEFEAEAGDPLQ